MILAMFCVILAVLLLGIGVLVYLKRLNSLVNNAYSGVLSVFEPDTEGRSQFEIVANNLAYAVAKNAMESFKFSGMQEKSVDKKLENSLLGEAAEEAIAGENPVMAMIYEQLPKKWKKRIAENPGQIPAMLNVAKKLGLADGLQMSKMPGQNGSGASYATY